MTVKRLTTINSITNHLEFDYELPKTPSTPYIVDDTQFQPMKEIMKQSLSSLSDDDINRLYDFPDGKDDGSSLSLVHKGFNDITELSVEVRLDQEKLNKAKEEATNRATAETKAKVNFEKLKSDLSKKTINIVQKSSN